ncbi:hypothetical protein ACNI3K_06260 [Demequina sp. SO4-13]|uniref:hypothetical protein n=1 Tax=Demequina sp. SO4-13 TaxID=3401027 RepID=UPI003AF7AF5B
MTHEYIVVEDPHASHERGEHGPPSAGSRLRRTAVVAAALACMGAAALLAWPDDDPEPAPELDDLPATAARTTAAVYQEWLDRTVLVECMTERGFPYEVRIVEHAESLETVAQFLELEPVAVDSEAPVPLLRQPDLYLGRGGEAMAERTRGGSACTMPRTSVPVRDEEAVAGMVAAARADDLFLATVAEQVWVDQHPAQVTHAISLLRHDRSAEASADDAPSWSDAAEVVVETAQDGVVWVPVVTESQELFSQEVGLTDSGGAVAVRVGDESAALNRGTYLTRTAAIQCGTVTISAGVKEPWGSAEELADIMAALGPACNALIRERIVDGESLADVYFD